MSSRRLPRLTAQLRELMLGNHRLLHEEMRGTQVGRAKEATRWLQLKVLDSGFTAEVVALRRKYLTEWNSLPDGSQLPLDTSSELSAEVSGICTRHHLRGIFVFGENFFPRLKRPFPTTPVPLGPAEASLKIRGSSHHKALPPLLRQFGFDDHVDLFVAHVLEGDTIPHLLSTRFRMLTDSGAKKAIRRLRDWISRTDETGRVPRRKRRAFAASDWHG